MRRPVGITLLLLGVALIVATSLTSGWSVVVLVSSSMEPWASPGALLVHRHVPADDLEVGDVVTAQGPAGRLVTHRVVDLSGAGDDRVARLQGDRSQLPDPVPVDLGERVPRVELVVPHVGGAFMAAPLLWGATGLLLVGSTALWWSRRPPTTEQPHDGASDEPAAAALPDPRVEALRATCEQLADDGVAPVVLRDVVRVRVAAISGLPAAAQAEAVLALDDAARSYVLACADADLDALPLVPPGSQRQRAGTAALDQWWAAVGDRVPAATAADVAPWVGAA